MTKITTLVFSALFGFVGSILAADKHDLSKIDVSKLPPAATKQGLSFTNNIQPLLKDSCVRCHGQNRPKARLRLDNLDGVLKGSEDGKVVLPGNSKGSLLVIAAARIDDDTAMPPKRGPGGKGGGGRPGGPPPGAGSEQSPGGPGRPSGGPAGPGAPGGPGGGGFGPPPKPLTAEQVSLLRAWVDQGAK